MRPGRIVALVIGCLLTLPALGLLVGGTALGVGAIVARDDDGFFEITLDPIETPTVAVVGELIDFGAEAGDPNWVLDQLDIDIRLRLTPASSDQEIFVGIARERDVDEYLRGVAYAEAVEVTDGGRVVLRPRVGDDTVAAPGEQTFWSQSVSGAGTQELVWEATSGRWAAVVMNADASPGVAVDAEVGARAPFVVAIAIAMLVVGTLVMAGAVGLIVWGAHGTRGDHPSGLAPGAPLPPPGASPALETTASEPVAAEPVRLSATLDPGLSRALWLVKWFLAIPHLIVLAFLWIAFVVLTAVAFFAILFTGRYPSGIFRFNVGVLRWTWRVNYYAGPGGLGTDRYPPFSLAHDPTYPATLEIEEPGRLSRGLVLVKWWLLAIPHYVVVAIITGSTWGWDGDDGDGAVYVPGLVGVLVLIAAVALLFRKRYPPSIFDLVIGLNRWVVRVTAYATLMTDEYPPFRLDQGGSLSPDGEPGDALEPGSGVRRE
jgi:Domain of unknown function (DUF4389)